MRASEWQYLCAVHDPPKSCCAIDYCCHTLDWAANILTSQKHFPSRLTLGGDAPGGSQASVRQLTNIFRRVYRMFAHAWFQHKDVFWTLENQEGIYVFYKTVCDIYQLIPEENYTIPPEAEGLALEEEQQNRRDHGAAPEHIIQQKRSGMPEKTSIASHADDNAAQTTISTGATTRRHKHTPSTGSFVTTIAEGDEEGEEPQDAEPPLDTASMINANNAESLNTDSNVTTLPHNTSANPNAPEPVESRSTIKEPPASRGDLQDQGGEDEKVAGRLSPPKAEPAEVKDETDDRSSKESTEG